MMNKTDRRRAATRASVNCETSGEWMNLARRYARMGAARRDDAAYCARKAIEIADEWADLFGSMAPGVRAKAESIICA